MFKLLGPGNVCRTYNENNNMIRSKVFFGKKNRFKNAQVVGSRKCIVKLVELIWSDGTRETWFMASWPTPK